MVASYHDGDHNWEAIGHLLGGFDEQYGQTDGHPRDSSHKCSRPDQGVGAGVDLGDHIAEKRYWDRPAWQYQEC